MKKYLSCKNLLIKSFLGGTYEFHCIKRSRELEEKEKKKKIVYFLGG